MRSSFVLPITGLLYVCEDSGCKGRYMNKDSGKKSQSHLNHVYLNILDVNAQGYLSGSETFRNQSRKVCGNVTFHLLHILRLAHTQHNRQQEGKLKGTLTRES